MQILGIKIEGLEARMYRQAVDKADIDLARNNYHMQTENIEIFLKNNARLKRQVQESLSSTFSPRKPVTKRPAENSK